MKSKNSIARPHISAHPDIEEVRRRLEAWRQTRQHGERIPEDLWISAAKLAGVHRPGTVAHALSLDYDALKERIESVNHLPLCHLLSYFQFNVRGTIHVSSSYSRRGRIRTDRIGLLARPIVQTTKCRDVAGWFSPTGWPIANVTKSGLRWAFPTVLYLRWLAKPVTCRSAHPTASSANSMAFRICDGAGWASSGPTVRWSGRPRAVVGPPLDLKPFDQVSIDPEVNTWVCPRQRSYGY